MSALPFAVNPFLYINGLEISNNVAAPFTSLDIAAGQCRDSTNVYQLELEEAITINVANNGLNGLDTGVFAASRIYAVYLIADPINGQLPGAMLSLSQSAPLLPFGYSAFRKIGYVAADSAIHLIKGYWAGNNNARLFMYDISQPTAITAGAAVIITGISLVNLVPSVNNTPVWIYSDMIPAAAGRAMFLSPYASSGASIVKITGQVSNVHVTANSLVMARMGILSGNFVPAIQYLWNVGGGDSVAINVAGYQFYI